MTNPLSSLNHGLSEELTMLRETTRQFVEKELAPIADAVDRDNDFPHHLWQKMGDLSDDRPPEFLSTHPAPENRQAALNSMIPAMNRVNPSRSKAPITEIDIVQ